MTASFTATIVRALEDLKRPIPKLNVKITPYGTSSFVKGIGTIGSCLVACILISCSTAKVSDLTKENVPPIQYSLTNNGLRLGVTPLVDPQQVKERFGQNLLAKGVLPVFIDARNEQGANVFYLSPDRFVLHDSAKVMEAVSSFRRSLAGSESAYVASGLLLSGPGLIAAASAATARMRENHQFAVNQLPTRTLSAGASARGYLFFQLPRGEMPKTARLLVQLQNLDDLRAETFTFPITLTHLNQP